MQPLGINRQSEIHTIKRQTNDIKEGQIVTGKVLKIHPNQTAEVQIGSVKMTAVLDAPLKAGERYWLQAGSINGQLSFKVLGEAPTELQGAKEWSLKLLQQLNIPETKNSLAVAQLFLKKNFTITKDSIMNVIGWLDGSKNIEKSSSIVQFMFKNELPITKDVFFALQSLDKNKSFHNMLSTLIQELTPDNSESATLLKNLLTTNLSSQEKLLGEKLILQLIKNTVNPDIKDIKENLSALQKLGVVPPTMTEKELAAKLIESINNVQSIKGKNFIPFKDVLRILGEANQAIASKREDLVAVALKKIVQIDHTGQLKPILEDIQETIKNVQSQPLPEIEGKLIKISQKLVSEFLKNLENNLVNLPTKQSENITRIIQSVSTLPLQEMESLSNNIGNTLFSIEENSSEKVFLHQKLSQNDWNQLAKLVQDDMKMLNISNPESAAVNIKKLISSLGLDFENSLLRMNADPEKNSQDLVTIKPLLMKLIQETQSQSVRETAEQVLHRITAQQILTHEAGPLQNIIVQIPLQLRGFQTDMTMQWSGRKNKDGNIDPEFCRVLFYLKLEQIDETVVDMQIQKKIITVSVYNERSDFIKQIAHPLIPMIKEHLNAKGFTLSNITFEAPKKEMDFIKLDSVDDRIMAGPYTGVDLKI
ncbi:hypothetical protein [Peribacillus alkalitolerans]|uniref:hypothetical protein n=1 Tax=Peribacillus alkalitolerans TaxID=1550385 RepID=UPI0013D48929|nr:hypothetical protein [Peribacillus alkalitolerans]